MKGSNMNSIIKEDLNELIKDNIAELEKFRDKTVFVVGANGLIAKYFTFCLLEASRTKDLDIKIVILVRNEEKAKAIYQDYSDQDIDIIVQDVCDRIEYGGNIDYILHAAGSSSPQFIINDPIRCDKG